MPTKLVDIAINEVSLVDKAANRKRFLIVKRAAEGGETTMNEAMLDEVREILKSGKKISTANMDKLKNVHASLSQFIGDNGIDDDGDDDAAEPAGSAGGKQKGGSQMEAKEIQKMLDDQKIAIEKAANEQLAALQKKLDDAEGIAKAERDSRLTSEYIAKAVVLDCLVIKAEEFGPVLKGVFEKAPEEFAKVMAVLTAANEAIKKGGIFKVVGGDGSATNGAQGQIDAKAAELRKSDSSLSKEQAVRKVLKENPELYAQHKAEQAQG